MVSQFEGLVPGGVEAALDGLCLLFALTSGVWDQFQLHIRVGQTIGVHRNQIPALFNCRERQRSREGNIRQQQLGLSHPPGVKT